jgi:hypothetical protein
VRHPAPCHPFNINELEQVSDLLRKGSVNDNTGIIADMLKTQCTNLMDALLDLLSEESKPNAQPLNTWRRQSSNCCTHLVTHIARELPTDFDHTSIAQTALPIAFHTVCTYA